MSATVRVPHCPPWCVAGDDHTTTPDWEQDGDLYVVHESVGQHAQVELGELIAPDGTWSYPDAPIIGVCVPSDTLDADIARRAAADLVAAADLLARCGVRL